MFQNNNAAIGTDDRMAVGVVVNVGVASAGVQVTAGTQEAEGVLSGIGSAIFNDIKDAMNTMKLWSTSCSIGGCATHLF